MTTTPHLHVAYTLFISSQSHWLMQSDLLQNCKNSLASVGRPKGPGRLRGPLLCSATTALAFTASVQVEMMGFWLVFRRKASCFPTAVGNIMCALKSSPSSNPRGVIFRDEVRLKWKRARGRRSMRAANGRYVGCAAAQIESIGS